MNFFSTQNPGIGGIDELTPSEEVFIMNLTGLPYQQGDIIYHNGTNLTVLHPGTSGQFLKTNGVASNPEWATVSGGGSSDQETLDVSTSQSVNTNQFVRADSTNGDITLTLINPATKQTVTVKKIDSSSNSVYVYSLSLIDDSTIAELNMEDESITLKWTGSTYDIV